MYVTDYESFMNEIKLEKIRFKSKGDKTSYGNSMFALPWFTFMHIFLTKPLNNQMDFFTVFSKMNLIGIRVKRNFCIKSIIFKKGH